MFNAEQEAERLRTLQLKKRKHRYQPSRLDKYQSEILALHRLGVSLSELQIYLRERKIVVARSTIHYWLKKHAAV